MAAVVKRSRGRRPSDKSARVHVQTYLTTEVGEMLEGKLERLRMKPSVYLRQLIERDLGLIEE